MDNKLQQLTEKLYAEGLEKGKAEGAALLEKARAEAAQIINAAQEKAAAIQAEAKAKAEELARTASADVRLAELQTVAAIKTQIEGSVTTAVAQSAANEAFKSGELTRQLIVEAVRAWNPSQDTGAQIIVPEAYAQEAKKAAADYLSKGVEIVTDGRVKVPFRIAPKEGGYYVSFAQGDFEKLLAASLRPAVAQLLFQ